MYGFVKDIDRSWRNNKEVFLHLSQFSNIEQPYHLTQRALVIHNEGPQKHFLYS
jgi:hypothetical protein